MVDWLDAEFSEQSDSSDEEFVLHDEDVVEDTSSSSEEEASDVDRSTVANQNTPQHTYGNHTVNGSSAATYNDRYATPIHTPLTNGNGHGLDGSYTNGKIGANRHRQEHHSHLYNPYGRISPRRSSGEREEYVHEYNSRGGALFPYSDQLPDRPLRELRVPFEIFSDTFNQFHDEQETMLRELKETEHEMLQMNTQLEEEIEIIKEECNDLKVEYKDICDENKQIREYIEEMHSFLVPYFSNIMEDNGDNEGGVKDMDVDKNNVDEGSEEKDGETDDELDEVNLGPFLIELFRQQQQLQQQKQQQRQEEQEEEQEEMKQGEKQQEGGLEEQQERERQDQRQDQQQEQEQQK